MQVNAINAALGSKVAELRKAHGWSQVQFAELFGAELGRRMDATTITRLEQGSRPVPVHELIALSRVLSVEPTTFLVLSRPLDDTLEALGSTVEALAVKANTARGEAEAAATQRDHLVSLRRYRDTHAEDDLKDGVLFMHTMPKFERPNWRELLHDAGISDDAIDTARSTVKGEPGPLDALFGSAPGSPDSNQRLAFLSELVGAVLYPPIKNNKKAGK